MPGDQLISVARIMDLFEELTPNPYHNDIIEATWQTIVNLGMANQYQKQAYLSEQVSLFTALCYPHVNLDYLKYFNDVIIWTFYHDDRVDSENGDFRCDPRLHERNTTRFVQMIRDPDSRNEGNTDDKQMGFLKYIVRRGKEMFNDDTYKTFLTELEKFIIYDTKTNSHARCSSLKEALSVFNKVRPITGGVPLCYVLTKQMVLGELPEPSSYNPMIFEDMDIKRLEDISAITLLLFNDIVSYERECNVAQATENMVVLLKELRQCDTSTAMQEVMDMIVQYFQEFDNIVQKRKSSGTLCNILYEYCQGLKTFMMANSQWSVKSGRYLTPTNPILECRTSL